MGLSFERGAPSAAAQLVGGGLLVTAPVYSTEWWIGSGLFAFGISLLIWGLRVNGRPWWQRKLNGALSPENQAAYSVRADMAFTSIGRAVGEDTPLGYEMALASIEPMLLLLKQAGIPIPRLRADGTKTGILRASRYLNLLHGPLQIGDYATAKRRAERAVPLINKVSEERLWKDVQRAFPSALPAPNSSPIRDRTGVLNAALYMVFHDWDHSLNDLTPEDQIMLLSGNLKAMVQDAIDGNLTIWVRKQRHGGNHVNPGSSYWEDHHLDWVREHGALSAWPNSGSGITQCFEPLVRKSDIERLYGPGCR